MFSQFVWKRPLSSVLLVIFLPPMFGLSVQGNSNAILVVVRVDKVLTSVVGRVDINQFHFSRIALLQELEHLQIVPFDHQVLRGVPVHALLRAGPQRAS